MNTPAAKFPPAFLEHQKRRLNALRAELRTAREAQDREKKDAQASGAEAREYEEDAQHLNLVDLEQDLESRTASRLEQIERALQKIADGTYGLSDASGQPIPIDRLEAAPEAIYTLAEQQARESAG